MFRSFLSACLVARFAVCIVALSVPAAADDDHDHHDMMESQLGTVHFPVSCSAEARKTFEKGVALLHSFWYEEAEKTFIEAQKQDPKCAMAHWGVAISLWHQLWDWPQEDVIARGAAELRKAQKPKAKTERERDYIAAAQAFYTHKGSEKGNSDHEARAQAYSTAMEKVYERYGVDSSAQDHASADHEAAAFYALSLLASEPQNDTTFANRKKAGAILEKLFETEPDHPGIAHYLIHTYDKPQLAQLGLPAARRYAAIAPASPHALHMPSHIFERVGDWPDDITSNLASIAATRKTAAMHMGGEAHQFHAMDFLIYAYLQSGREDEAVKWIEEVKTMPSMKMGDMDMRAFAAAKFPAMYALEMHRWADAAKLEVVPDSSDGDKVYTYWARAIGAARSGDVVGAKKDVAEIEAIRKDYETRHKNYAAESTEMAENEASAWVKHAEGHDDEAVSLMRKVADHEDSVGEEQTSIPAREMLADILLEMHRPDLALAEYQGDLKFNPRRFNGLYGAAQAAEMAGKASEAGEYYALLVKTCEGGGSGRPELAKAKQAVVAAN
jgi:tetratricopeptide (TPR) repeat protein